MRIRISLVVLVFAVEVVAAPAPFPRREKPPPADAVVLDFSPLEAPAPPHARWYMGIDVFGAPGDLHACLYESKGTAGKGAANRMVERWSRALRTSPGSQWLSARVDASGQKLILFAKSPNRISTVEVRLNGLPREQTPVRSSAR